MHTSTAPIRIAAALLLPILALTSCSIVTAPGQTRTESRTVGGFTKVELAGSGDLTVQIVTIILIILMSASTFTTQRQLMMKNMPASALDNPFAKQQKMLLYLMPIFFAISGVNFPIGVLLYWLTTNVWSMCQQFYVIRKMPAPGSLAEKAMQERRLKKGKPVEEFTVKGLDKPEEVEAPKPSGQRVQPSRNKKKKGGATKSAQPKKAAGSSTDPKPQTDN